MNKKDYVVIIACVLLLLSGLGIIPTLLVIFAFLEQVSKNIRFKETETAKIVYSTAGWILNLFNIKDKGQDDTK